ncbi:MAG: uroporphyrinogen decarboxylase family protein [Armatimonadia bacterium]
MLPRERVATTLSFREPDLVPWGEHSIDYTTYEMVLGRESLVQGKMKQTRAMWEGRRDDVVASYKRDVPDLVEALGMDIVTIGMCPAKGARETPLEQIDHETFRDSAGNIHRVSKTTHDLRPLKLVPQETVLPTVEDLQRQIDDLDANGVPKPDESVWEVSQHVMDRLKATHWFNICIGDIGYPMVGRTDEEQYLNLALHPELHAKLTELQAKRVIAMLPWYAERGYDSVMPCGDLGSSTGLLASPRILREHVVYWWKEYTEAAKKLGLRVIKHCCGCIWEALDCIVDGGYEGYEGIQASGGMDMKRLKELYGDKLVLWGGVTNESLILGTPEDIEREALYALKYGAPGGGFILGASHSLAVGTKYENLMAMRNARERWGGYPISL